jgi:hypothetical protein
LSVLPWKVGKVGVNLVNFEGRNKTSHEKKVVRFCTFLRSPDFSGVKFVNKTSGGFSQNFAKVENPSHSPADISICRYGLPRCTPLTCWKLNFGSFCMS